jgi:hypothetical protein
VIVGKCDIHHRADLDLVTDRDRPPFDLMHTEDAGLRRVEDRCRHQRAIDAAIRDREGAAGQLRDRQFAVARLATVLGDGLFDLGKTHSVGVAHHRDDEALLGADRDPDVVMVLVDDVVAVDFGVDRRQLLERDDRGLDKDRHKAEPDAVLFLEAIAVTLAQRDRLAHIDLVEGRQHRGGVLRRFKTLGDPAPQPAHPHVNLAFIGGRCRERRFFAPTEGEHIRFRDPSAGSSRRNSRAVDPVFFDQLADCGP